MLDLMLDLIMDLMLDLILERIVLIGCLSNQDADFNAQRLAKFWTSITFDHEVVITPHPMNENTELVFGEFLELMGLVALLKTNSVTHATHTCKLPPTHKISERADSSVLIGGCGLLAWSDEEDARAWRACGGLAERVHALRQPVYAAQGGRADRCPTAGWPAVAHARSVTVT